jgi:hypothetical protein
MKRSYLAYGLGLSLAIGGAALYKAPALSKAKQKIVLAVSPSYSLDVQNQFKVGTEVISRVDWESSGNFSMGEGEAAMKQSGHTQVGGELRELVFEDDGVLTKSFIILDKPKFSVDLNGSSLSSDMTRAIAKDFSVGVVITRQRDGLIKTLEFPSGFSDYGRELMHSLLRTFQVQLPEGQRVRDWSADEIDSQGTAAVSYQLAGMADGKPLIVKQKHLYRSLTAKLRANFGRQGFEVNPQGETQITLDDKTSALSTVQGEERLGFANLDGKPIGENTMKFSLKVLARETRTDLGNVKAIIMQNFASAKSYQELYEDFLARQERFVYEQRLGNTTLEDIFQGLEELDKLGPSQDRDDKGTELFLKLRALIALHPEQVPAIPAHLMASPYDSTLVQTAISALTNMSTPSAQRALVDFTELKRSDAKAMDSLVPNLGFLENPEVFVTEALKEYRKDPLFAAQADYAYGTSALKMGQSEKPEIKERFAAIENEIVANAAAAKDGPELNYQIDILGNLGSEKGLPKIKEALEHKDPAVRNRAAYALRNNTDEASRLTLVEVMKDDREATVRKAAAEALVFYTPTRELMSLAIDCLTAEKNYEVRIALLDLVNRGRFIDPNRVSELIRTASESDSDENVRSYARALMSEASSS